MDNFTLVGSLKSHFPQVGIRQNLPKPFGLSSMVAPSCSAPNITCGLRGGPRKPLWRSKVLSTEAIQAVQSLKLAKSTPSKLEEVFGGRLTRLLKADLLDTLTELQRQNELDLALKVFKFVRNEVWYKPDVSLYSDMIRLLGKNKLIEMAEEVFLELKEEGLEPDTRAYTEMIGAYLKHSMIKKAMEVYGLMKASGCSPDKLTFTILIRNLERVGEEELLAAIKNDCAELMDYPEKFLEVVERKHPKRRTVSLV
ncbi:Pentatricopeptide repeat [Parasponia andersonii]|uniref:Pentatricopeptide repeat n=1 Tax=Parasponia andersonii TaxID=3476 RepID=A0A2P5DWR3_PARAD|nr:Pentatricopeptide repeat [Parasponia andersonii]